MAGGNTSATPKVEFISPSSPLYLHPNESTSLSLPSKKFNGENYDLWTDAVRNALDAKNKLAFIEGKVKRPVTPEGQEESLEAVAWRQCNAMACNSTHNLTVEELTQLRTLLAKSEGNNKTSGMNNKTRWLLDSGASHHMTGQRHLLENIHSRNPSTVGLPNGSHIIAREHGKVVLSDNFVLKDVLYVPSLTCDLISVQQLINENNCTVTFYSNHCVIQDLSTRMKIGRGEHEDGVYYFQGGRDPPRLRSDTFCIS